MGPIRMYVSCTRYRIVARSIPFGSLRFPTVRLCDRQPDRLAAAKGFSFAAVQLPADQRGHAAHNHQRRDAPRCCATHPLAPKVLCRHAQLRQAKRSVKSALSNLRCACLLHRCRRDFRAYVHAEQNAIGLVVDGPSLTVIFEYATATTSAAATTVPAVLCIRARTQG